MSKPASELARAREDALLLAARVDGVARNQLTGGISTVDRALKELVAEGLIFRCVMSHKNVRYYADKRAADRLQQAKSQITIPSKKTPKFDPDTPMVITPQTKFTVCPAPHLDRWHLKQVSNW